MAEKADTLYLMRTFIKYDLIGWTQVKLVSVVPHYLLPAYQIINLDVGVRVRFPK